MRIIAMSDIHGKHNKLTVPDGDVLIVAGDVTLNDLGEAEEFLAWMGRQRHRFKIFVPGNCDGIFEIDTDLMAEECMKWRISLLIDSGVRIKDQLFWGSPVTPTYGNMAFNRDPGEAIQEHWDLIPNDCSVLITHGPPFGVLDQVAPEKDTPHLGCRDLAERVKFVRPKLHFFGHIHGGYGSIERDGTRYFNVAICTERFRPTNPVTEVTFEPSSIKGPA